METKQLILSPAEAKKAEGMYRIQKRSVDARQRELKVHLTVLVDEQGRPLPKDAPIPLYEAPHFQTIPTGAARTGDPVAQTSPTGDSVAIIGAGPAGLFAALTLLEHGIKPVIYERGKDVSARKVDIAQLNRNNGLNPESNYCFGEGGAGTFSDGKLFSRSKKRGNMQRVMELFHYFGANDGVLYESHAHIGSDKLPGVIKRMRECIIEHGGEIRFGERIDSLRSFMDTKGQLSQPVILAIGHSAHDTYRMLAREGVRLETKGFAMGVRCEHPQRIINDLMYHLRGRSEQEKQRLISEVGNASYSLVTQVNGRGVYSFCMCPGGHIVPAGSSQGSCVVNGMSASHRNSPYANSGIVVEIRPEDIKKGEPGLEGLEFQEELERLAYQAAQAATSSSFATTSSAASSSSSAAAPAQRLRDFVEGRLSKDLPKTSYLPGMVSSRLDEWLPPHIGRRLQQGFRDFDRKYPGFLTNEAVILGVESRSSSPVRIVRDPETLESVSTPWLYPVGEGAGYAGGITSSALDGINAAEAVVARLLQEHK